MAGTKAFDLVEDTGARATRGNGDYAPRVMGPVVSDAASGVSVAFGISGEKSGVMSLLFTLAGETRALPLSLARIMLERCEEVAEAFNATATGETFKSHVAATKARREAEAAEKARNGGNGRGGRAADSAALLEAQRAERAAEARERKAAEFRMLAMINPAAWPKVRALAEAECGPVAVALIDALIPDDAPTKGKTK